MKSTTRLTCWLLFALTCSASAEVSTVRQYRLGEDDSGAVSGSATTQSKENSGLSSLTISGPATYSDAVVVDDFTTTALAMNFAGASLATSPVIAGLTDNFGLQAWVKPASASITVSQSIVYNGDSSANGWGLVQSGDKFRALFGGVTYFGAFDVAVDTWTHLALIRVSGIATFYVNGIALASSNASPLAPLEHFSLGGKPLPAPAEFFTGALDEVRVFTLAPASGNPLRITREAATVRLDWLPTEPATTLQYSTDLSSTTWNPVLRSLMDGLFQSVDPMDSPAKFYRVVAGESSIVVPLLMRSANNEPPSPVALDSDTGSPTVFVYIPIQLSNNKLLTLDFSSSIAAVYDAKDLTFQWQISYDNPEYPNPYTFSGITGWNTPALHMPRNSLLPGPVTIQLFIGRTSDLSFSQLVQIPGTVTSTTLTPP